MVCVVCGWVCARETGDWGVRVEVAATRGCWSVVDTLVNGHAGQWLGMLQMTGVLVNEISGHYKVVSNTHSPHKDTIHQCSDDTPVPPMLTLWHQQ